MQFVVRAATVAMAIFGFCLVGASTPVWFGHAYVGGVDCGSPVDPATEGPPPVYDEPVDEWERDPCTEEVRQTRWTAALMVVAGLLLMIGAGLALLAGRSPERGLVLAQARTEGADPRP